MTERRVLPDREWREVSARVSPQIEAGLDLSSLTERMSTKQRRMFLLPKDFRVHKRQHNVQLQLTVAGLSLYGELDRVVAGLLPLQSLPAADYRIADYSTLNTAVDAAYFFSVQAHRPDLVGALQPMQDLSVSAYTIPDYYLSGAYLGRLLDLSEDERQGRSHWLEKDWVRGYVQEPLMLGKAWLLGGSPACPQDWLLGEVERYARAVFATPGYEPFTDHPYLVRD